LKERVFHSPPRGGNARMNDEGLKKLHTICVSSLHYYVLQSRRTCDLLGEIEGSPPVSKKLWTKLLQQQKNENLAHELYQTARAKLFERVRPSSAV
jgi:hypothetical protein